MEPRYKPTQAFLYYIEDNELLKFSFYGTPL